jgi:hypothetical protein
MMDERSPRVTDSGTLGKTLIALPEKAQIPCLYAGQAIIVGRLVRKGKPTEQATHRYRIPMLRGAPSAPAPKPQHQSETGTACSRS